MDENENLETEDLELDQSEEGLEGEELEGQEQGEGEPKADEKPAEEGQPKPEEKPEAEVLRERNRELADKHSVAKKEANIGRKALLAQEKAGLLDRDEAAQEMGITRQELDAFMDHKPQPEPGDNDHVQALLQRFDEDVKNPALLKFVEKAHGDKGTLEKKVEAFKWAAANDPSVMAALAGVTADDFTDYLFTEGAKYVDDYEEATQNGNAKGLLAKIRELKAENAALKAKKSTTEAKTETAEQEDEEETPAPQPKTARDAHLARLLNG